MLEVCARISLSGQRRHSSFVEDGLVLAVIGRCALVDRLGFAREEFRRVKVNFSFANFEGQDEISSEASAVQREVVQLAKPFLILHVTKTSHLPCCKALDPLKLAYIRPQCWDVGLHCIL